MKKIISILLAALLCISLTASTQAGDLKSDNIQKDDLKSDDIQKDDLKSDDIQKDDLKYKSPESLTLDKNVWVDFFPKYKFTILTVKGENNGRHRIDDVKWRDKIDPKGNVDTEVTANFSHNIRNEDGSYGVINVTVKGVYSHVDNTAEITSMSANIWNSPQFSCSTGISGSNGYLRLYYKGIPVAKYTYHIFRNGYIEYISTEII